MVGLSFYFSWSVVVKIWECNFIFSSYLLSYYQLRNIIKLIPVFILLVYISEKWLEFWTSWDSHVKSFCCTERLHVEKIIVILVN